jgi:23S rRNA (adenine2503-C2)-methyltransferase
MREAHQTAKPVLSGYPLHELRELLSPLPSFRARQVFASIARGALSFKDMTALSLALREELETRFALYSSAVTAVLTDPDGTVKLQIALRDGLKIEAAILTDGGGRKTACLSTQAGCPMGCVFCKTGALGFSRNLDAGEMAEQFLHIRFMFPETANVVFMGMGEPLLNLGEIRRALAVLTDREGLGMSPRRFTLSTSGAGAGIRELADGGPGLRLAVSLTTADEALRKRLMPRANPLPALKEDLRYYQKKHPRRITLEAALLGGVNTRPEDAEALAAFAKGLNVAVNLIPWNPVEGLCFEGRPIREPGGREIARFTAQLETRGLKVTRRYRKGRGISGACGQLGSLQPHKLLEHLHDPGKNRLEDPDEGAQDAAEDVDPL